MGDHVDLQVTGDIQLSPVAHHHWHLASQQSPGFGLAHPPGHQTTSELMQGALHREQAGLLEQGHCLLAALELAVPARQQEQVREERLEALGAEIVGRLPANLERPAALQSASPDPHGPLPGRQPAAPSEERRGIGTVVPSGHAEGFHDLDPLPAPRQPAPRRELSRPLVALPDPMGHPPAAEIAARAPVRFLEEAAIAPK